MEEKYFLRAHVHCCRRGDAFVFLDLKQDEYTLVAGPAAQALNALTDTTANGATTNPATAADDPLRELEQGGLLTQEKNDARTFAVTDVDLAVEPLLDIDTELAKIRPIDLWNFSAACTAASIRLRWHRLEDTVTSVARRKARHRHASSLDLDRARQLTAVFNRLRRLFPANYRCLFDSLALAEFLARYQIFPTWVFGVRLEPWAAHCWLQQGPVAFNESVEETARYTPIMAV